MMINRSCKLQGCSLIYTGMVKDLDVPVLLLTLGIYDKRVTCDAVTSMRAWRLKLTGTTPEITNIEVISPNPELMKNFTPTNEDNYI